jgi:hypothetical protein
VQAGVTISDSSDFNSPVPLAWILYFYGKRKEKSRILKHEQNFEKEHFLVQLQAGLCQSQKPFASILKRLHLLKSVSGDLTICNSQMDWGHN